MVNYSSIQTTNVNNFDDELSKNQFDQFALIMKLGTSFT